MPDQQQRVPFRKAVLGLNGGPTDELVVHLGCQLAKAANAELIAIHVIEVDWRHELSEAMSEENERASAVLDLAEGIAEQYRVRLTGDLLQAREVAAALVDEAIEVGADAIIIGLPYRQRFGGDFQIGDSIPYVFKNAPCQVIVVREPVASIAGRSGETDTDRRGGGGAPSDVAASEQASWNGSGPAGAAGGRQPSARDRLAAVAGFRGRGDK
jgi:nucleotide-binding universal stress UspA family protein